MPVELLFRPYKLTCDLLAEKDLRVILEPQELSHKPDLSYEIFIKPEDNHQLQFLFGNSKKMYSYIEFHRENCFHVDFDTIEQEKRKFEKGGNFNHLDEMQESVQAPVSFRFVLMGDEKSPTIPLKGTKRLLSRYSRLESIIAEQIQTIESLRSQLDQKEAEIVKLREKNQVLQFEKEQLVQEKSREKEIEKPKKKVHTETRQNGTLQSRPQQSIKTHHQDYSYKQQPHYEDFDDLSFHDNPYQNQSSMNVPPSNQNNYRNDQISSPQLVSSQDSSSNEISRDKPPQIERSFQQPAPYHPEEKESDSKASQQYRSKDSIYSFGKQSQVNNVHKEKLKENDIAKLIEVFVGTCLVDVGYNERGQPKTGYVCVFCEKIFKESEFLRKHVLTRHPEVLESHANEAFLVGKLNQYKANREAQLHAQMRQKKMEKMLKNNN